QADFLQSTHRLGAARDGPCLAKRGEHRVAYAFPLGSAQQTPEGFAGHQDHIVETAGDEIAQPGANGCLVGSIEDAHHGAAHRPGSFLLEHGRQLLELPAFGKRHGATLKRKCHEQPQNRESVRKGVWNPASRRTNSCWMYWLQGSRHLSRTERMPICKLADLTRLEQVQAFCPKKGVWNSAA